MTKQITVRGVSPELDRRLTQLSQSRKQSVNATVLDILSRAVGQTTRRPELARFTTWSTQELAEFEGALAAQRKVNPKDWR